MTHQNKNLDKARAELGDIDQELIDLLNRRFSLIRQIGAIKKTNGIAIEQRDYWQQKSMELSSKSEEMGINQAFFEEVYSLIHEESIRIQKSLIED